MFKLGDTVTWRSQAGGNWKTKTGVIVEVRPDGYKLRRGESYVVRVKGRHGGLYWPRVAQLRHVVVPSLFVAGASWAYRELTGALIVPASFEYSAALAGEEGK
jgi:hypothetical protein